MIRDRLLINYSKTALILIGSKQQLSKLQPISISVGNLTINNSSVVKNLGCWFDAKLSMANKTLVSKETVVLRRWEIETEIDFIKRVDKG